MSTEAGGLTVAYGEPLVWGRRTYVMGIINLTPDSFSEDGLDRNVDAAVKQALDFQEAGADFLDLGAESTRPGHRPIAVQEELDRLLPALETVARVARIPISVDTYKAEVARQALAAGACIVNDVWGLKRDPAIAEAAAGAGALVVLMHNQKGTWYRELLDDVKQSLRQSCEAATSAGVPQDNIVVDPGFGFGKTPDHNLELLARLAELRDLGHPILVGTSRKSTIGRVLDRPPGQRWEGTAATLALAIAGGADIVRVHDAAQAVDVCRMSDAVVRGWRPASWPG